MAAPSRRHHLVTAAALVLTATVTGCSDAASGPEASAPTPTTGAASSPSASGPSASSSPSPTETPEPRLPQPPAAKDSEAGRKAFAEFVVARWGYALRTNDARAVTGLSPQATPCQGCPPLEAELRKRSAQGWYVDFPGAEVRRVDVAPGDEAGVHVARATIDVPASQSYFDDGELRNENAARKGATFEVRMRLDGKRYALLAFRVA